MTALGFRPTPRGLHSAEMGTANATIVLRDGTYFEVLGVVADTEANAPIRDGLAQGRHLFGLVLKTDDAAAAQTAFDGLGIGAGAMRSFSRPVELPDGRRDAAFRTAHLHPSVTPGAYGFACQHLTPAVVWRPDYLEQPNAVTGIRRVIAVASDPAGAASAWGRIPGMEVSGPAVRIGERTLEFVDPAAFARRFGPAPAARPALAALVFETSDLSKARAALESGGIGCRSDDHALQVTREGVVFRFEMD